MPATHSKKVGTEACFPMGNITFSFNYTLQSFGSWTYQLLQFCSAFLVYTRLELLKSLWSLLSDSPLNDAPSIFNRKHTMPTMPRCCNLCRMRSGIVLLDRHIHGVTGKSRHLESSICLSNSNISLHINGTFTYMQITYAVGTETPPYNHRTCFFRW